MTAKKKSLIRILSALLAVIFMSGCFDGDKKEPQVAGGDDYPNGIETLGKKSAQARSDSAEWNGFDSIPRSGPGLYDTVQVPDSVPDTSKAGTPSPKRALAKRSALDSSLGGVGGLIGTPILDTVVTKVVDTAKGVVEAVRTQVSDSGAKQVDSTVFVPADPAKPGALAGVNQVVRRITSPDSTRTDLWKFMDADGDGLLSPKDVAAKARIELTANLPDGITVLRTQVLGAGADLDFNKRGDNKLLSASLAVTSGADTLRILTWLDADGDSVLFDFAKDSNVVELVEKLFDKDGPITHITRNVRIVARKDSTKNYPIHYTEVRFGKDGSIREFQGRGLIGASTPFLPGDEARWTHAFTPPDGDSILISFREYQVRLAVVPGYFRANTLFGYELREIYRSKYRHFDFRFRSDAPVSNGHWISTGSVLADLKLLDNKTVIFSGDATVEGMAGAVTDSVGGDIMQVRFDLGGAIVPKKP